MTKKFSNYSDLLTFTRASKGHALRPVSYGDELVTNGDFSDGTTGWTLSPVGTHTVSSGVLTIDRNGAGSTPYITQGISTVVGNVYLLSFEVKAGSTDAYSVQLDGVYVIPATSVTTGTKTLAFVASETNTDVALFSRNSIASILVLDNVSVKEVTFDESDGTLTLFEHPNNVPRVEWDADRNRLGLLVEEQRTNLDTQSTYFAGAASVTATKNYTAPDGSQDASTLDYTAVSTPYLNTTNISFSSGTTYSFSFYFKRGTGTQAVQTLLYGSTFNSGGANCVVVFDLDNETTSVASGTFVSHSITNVGGGWYRCMCSATATATASQNQQILRLGAADDGNYDYIFGKQVEVGSFPTSYIKTTGSTATRSADVASIPVADFGFNQGVGALLVEAKRFGTSSEFPRIAQLTDGTSSNRISVSIYGAGNTAYANVYDGGVSQASLNEATSTGADTYAKLGFSFADNDFAFAVDGVVEGTDTSGTVPDNISEMLIGDRVSADQQLNGHIKSIKYYPRRLTNAQLQDITS